VSGTFRSTLDANINGLTVGKGGGSVSTNTAVGINSLSANTSGSGNTSLGWGSALAVNTGSRNTYIGQSAAYQASSGSDNVAIGWSAANTLTTGIGNIFIGSPGAVGSNGISTGNYNTIIGTNVTGLSSSLSNTIILADGQGNQRLYINNSGQVGIGTTSPAFRLSVVYSDNNYNQGLVVQNTNTGAQSISGIVVANSSGSYVGQMSYYPSNYFVSGLQNTMTFASIGQQKLGFVANTSSSGSTAQDIYFSTLGSNSTYQMQIKGNGNIQIGTNTDAGYKLDVNGTARVSDVFHANNSAIGFGAVRVRETSGGYGVVVHPNASTSTYTQYNASSITFWNGTVASTISQISGSLYNDVNSANAIYNRFSNNHVFTITSGGASVGASSLNASAVLEATSTTRGFLPPRMTTTQKNAISSPAAGLVVYDTTLGKLCVYTTAWETITSA
jgi:hypothetical protein